MPEEFDSLAQPDKDAVCRSLFHAVNWLIEVINTFARAKPMRAKVIQRVRDVILLKEKVTTFITVNILILNLTFFFLFISVLSLFGS